MSSNLGSPAPIQPLNIGDIVTGGFRLYRSHIKDYFLIALKANVWLLVPIYGWAKYYALSSLISRLSFGELINQPEDIKTGQKFVNSRLGQFLLQLVLMFLIYISLGLGFAIVFGIVGGVLGVAIGGIFQNTNPAFGVLSVLLGIVLFAAIFLGFFWFTTRFYLADVTLAIEDDTTATSAISRSFELTKGNIWRIVGITFIAFLITLPLQIVVQVIVSVLQLVLTPLIQGNSGIFTLLYFVLIFAISFSSGAVIIPFWQAIKATIYYDLRSRREGLGLRLRDNEI
ncbi:MAG: DUF975 domain-containing protein [Rivularia sp. (in: cyanobacteria)]